MEYFYEPIVRAIASAVGPVVTVDECTTTKKILYYARVFVELDLSKEKEECIIYERSGHCAIASLGYENHPSFCMICEIIGHATSD